MNKHCTPCNTDVAALNKNEAQKKVQEFKLQNWQLKENSTWLERKFTFPDFVTSLEFVNKVGAIAEQEGHHPDIYFTWGKVIIKIQTHKIKGLHENDFILAQQINNL